MKTENNYIIKIDDMLLYLLKEYHEVDASNALAFFHDRVLEMKDLPPNVTEKSRPSTIGYKKPLDKRQAITTGQTKYRGRPYDRDDSARFYVLRGFYPDTNLPFKMIVVYANEGNRHHRAESPACVKIIMGMKPHHSVILSNNIEEYKDHVADSVLLNHKINEEKKIGYTYKDFKCMRPKSMELYHAKNHEQKQKERAAAKRKVKNVE